MVSAVLCAESGMACDRTRVGDRAARSLTIPLTLFILLCTAAIDVAMAQAAGAPVVETYQSATLDADGQLAILKPNGRQIIVRREGEQTAFSTPVISSARTAVAAQAMFPNCCTSYDIPLQLVVFAGGKLHRFSGVGLPIFHWGFADSGTRIG